MLGYFLFQGKLGNHLLWLHTFLCSDHLKTASTLKGNLPLRGIAQPSPFGELLFKVKIIMMNNLGFDVQWQALTHVSQLLLPPGAETSYFGKVGDFRYTHPQPVLTWVDSCWDVKIITFSKGNNNFQTKYLTVWPPLITNLPDWVIT